MVLPFRCQLTHVVLEERPLNGGVCQNAERVTTHQIITIHKADKVKYLPFSVVCPAAPNYAAEILR